MVRIGKQITHYEHIDASSTEAVFSPGKEHRYLLSMSYADSLLDRDRKKSITVILKNPSAADEKMADPTIRKVETFVYRHFNDVRYLHILNILAVRATDPAGVNECLREKGPVHVIGPENDRIITATLAEADYIIVAWGNHSGIDPEFYQDRVDSVVSMLSAVPRRKIFHIEGNRKTKHPLHGLMWGYDYKVKPAFSMLS